MVIQPVGCAELRVVDDRWAYASPSDGGNPQLAQSQVGVRQGIEEERIYPRADVIGELGVERCTAGEAVQFLREIVEVEAPVTDDGGEVGVAEYPPGGARDRVI